MREMTPEYAKKLSTQTLEYRLKNRPYNYVIVRELHNRRTKEFKCQVEAQKILERERAKFITKLSLGYKTEAYYSEREALSETIYTFESLSPSEKEIWNNELESCKI